MIQIRLSNEQLENVLGNLGAAWAATPDAPTMLLHTDEYAWEVFERYTASPAFLEAVRRDTVGLAWRG